MMNYKIGDVVRSAAGHDKDSIYIVVAEDGEYVLVANGKTRSADAPKRKKKKHLLYVGRIDELSAEYLYKRSGAFSVQSGTSNSELRKLLKSFIRDKDYD